MKVEINQKEIQALDIVLDKVECKPAVGMVIGTFRVRVQQELNKERDKQLKEKYTPKKKDK